MLSSIDSYLHSFWCYYCDSSLLPITNYVDTITENEGPEETINDTISEKSNIIQNGLKLVSIWETTLLTLGLWLSTQSFVL